MALGRHCFTSQTCISWEVLRVVTLSKVKKHGKERKESLIGNIRSWVDL